MRNKPTSALREDVLGPWPNGVNNSVRAFSIPQGSALDCLNMDFADDGRVSIRSGRSVVALLANAHSLRTIGGKAFISHSGNISVINSVEPFSTTAIRSGIAESRISYAERGGEVWWSNGVECGRISTDNSDHPWTVPAPANIPYVTAGAGSLLPGEYRIAITHSTADGEESLPSAVEQIVLSQAGGITVTLPTAAAGVSYTNVYCTRADGAILQQYLSVPATDAEMTIGSDAQGKQLRNRVGLSPLPPGDAICFHGNRLCSMKGEFLYYSLPWEYGVCDLAQDYIVLGASGTILASVCSGMYVAADRTWFYQGDDISSAIPMEKLPFGAASGTVFDHPSVTSPVVGWYSQEGLAVGTADGSVKMLQRDAGFIAPSASSGATWVRQRDGLTHVVVSLDATAAYSKQASVDFLSAMDRYNDDATTMSINLTTGATSRYGEFNLDSFGQINGDEYGCASDGLYLLEGETDAGEEIQSVLDFGHVGAGSEHLKSPVCAYVAGLSSAPLIITITLPDGTSYDYPARSYSQDVERVQRHDGMKGLMNKRQAWFDVVLRNDGGEGMEVFSATLVVNESRRRI